jgi:site-specific recombinase XerD
MTNNNSISISEAKTNFLDQLAVGKQPRTVQSYNVALRRFEHFLNEKQELDSSSLTERLTVDHAIEFAKSLQGLAPATIRNYLAAISEFYRHLFALRFISADVADHERLFSSFKKMRPRFSNLPHVPPDEVIDALIQAAGTEPERKRKQSPGDQERSRLQRLRDVALLLALKSSGMRLGETLALRRGDLDYRNKSAVVTGKGRKQRIVYFDDVAWKAMQEYLQARQDGAHIRSLAQVPLFARHDRRSGERTLPLTRQRVEQIFVALAERTQVDPKPTPHWFRHWFATQVLDRTQDLAALQDMLGHESPVTTRIYAKVSTRRLREVHKAAFGEKKKDE